jgi:DNA-binding NtrC family response regulator
MVNKRNTKKIVVVDDSKDVLIAVRMLLKDHFDEVITLSSPNTLLTVLQEERPDVVLLDMNFTTGINNGNEGLFWLREIIKVSPDVPVILITAYADIDLAVRCIKEGASGFIVKPWDNDKLVETVIDALELHPRNRLKPGETAEHPTIYWGNTPAMKQLQTLVERVSNTEANILITGESGTGKELLAREIHQLSARKNKPMVTVDLGAISESLFESELFGHVKGAFTDAHTDRKGLFEAAEGGTIFLDEIGNIPLHLQAKLLTVIQRRSIVRVGSNKEIPVNIRVICATNRNLEEMVSKGEFREDLLYRINTVQLHIPALRERKADILPMAELFTAIFCDKYDAGVALISEEARQRIMAHPWPGNVRELENAVERAVIVSDDGYISPDYFPLPKKPGDAPTLEDLEQMAVVKAVESSNGNLSEAAKRLGISRQTLYNKLKKLRI